jgi:hypothetical protein
MTARSRNGEAIADDRGRDDDRGDNGERPAVGGEKPSDPAQRDLAAWAFSAAVGLGGLFKSIPPCS